MVNGCKKDSANTQVQQTVVDKVSIGMTENIQNFEKQMEYFRDNPGLKSDETKYVLQAILDWEATLNYNYCDSYIPINDAKEYDTTISLPVDAEFYMTLSDVSERYYNAILAAVQTHYYVNAPFANQKLLAVDLETTGTYNGVHITTTIGNASYISHPPYDWKFGEWGGTCDGNYFGESDAAQETAKYVRAIFYEAPPSGTYWYFTGIQTKTAEPLDEENGVLIYDNPNDNDIDNYEDYLIYYAASSVPPGLTSGVRCVENSPELNFYKQSYKTLTQGWINASGGKKYKESIYVGKDKGLYLVRI